VTGIQFKAIREKLQLSQEELAQLLCLSGKQAISNIETGFRNPSKLTMVLMEAFVKLPEKRSKELQSLLLSISKKQGHASVEVKK